jgi:hypothetical protein
MTLEHRLRKLEALSRGDDAQADLDVPATDSIIRELGFDPIVVRAAAEKNGQSIAEIIAGEMGISYREFQAGLQAKSEN